MNCCSLVHHVSGVCATCPNNEECNLKVILEMQKTLDEVKKPIEKRSIQYGAEAID